ncbi:VC0807 family protein [Bacillus sp. 1P10SD]|uniref:VC0807 family protein n=1 Tax=Bacillus sp. 1P10SD TaxID=3132265 RepID=UPI0039A662AF
MMKRKDIYLTLLINGLVPWGLYLILSKHMSSVAALSIATLAPLADNLYFLIKRKKLDVFGLLMLFTFLLTLLLVMLGGSEKLLLIKESFITAVVGFIFLLSLLFKKPLMYHLALRFIGTTGFADNWKYDYFRFVMRLMTFVWGLVLVLEATVRITLVFALSTATYLAVSNIVLYGFIGGAILWTVFYRRISAQKLKVIISNKVC